jgi:hypothetical protein
MDVMMSTARPEGIGVHYYVMAGSWGNKGMRQLSLMKMSGSA